MLDNSCKSLSYAADCAHLKACRRIAKLIQNTGVKMARGCNGNCSAYAPLDSENYITVNEAIEYARDGVYYIRQGYDEYDVYTCLDLERQSRTLKEILEGGINGRNQSFSEV